MVDAEGGLEVVDAEGGLEVVDVERGFEVVRGVGTATATTAMAVPLFQLTPWHIIALEQKTTVVLASLVMTSTLHRKMTWHSSGADGDCIIICVEKGVASRVIRVSV